jgi:hypothetical protein
MSDDYIEVTDVVPFQTDEEVAVDLSKVSSSILPVCQNVLGEIRKASRDIRKDGATKGLKLELRIVDGIPTPDSEGNVQYKYRGKVVFPNSRDLLYWADTKVLTKDYYKGDHLKGFSFFLNALGIDTRKAPVKVNDEFLSSLIGRKVLFSIKHVPNQTQNEAGEWVDDGTMKERVYGWKKAMEE